MRTRGMKKRRFKFQIFSRYSIQDGRFLRSKTHRHEKLISQTDEKINAIYVREKHGVVPPNRSSSFERVVGGGGGGDGGEPWENEREKPIRKISTPVTKSPLTVTEICIICARRRDDGASSKLSKRDSELLSLSL